MTDSEPITDSAPITDGEPAEGAPAERPLQTVARTLRLALVIVGVLVAALSLWVWLSSGSDAKLPFGYGSFE